VNFAVSQLCGLLCGVKRCRETQLARQRADPEKSATSGDVRFQWYPFDGRCAATWHARCPIPTRLGVHRDENDNSDSRPGRDRGLSLAPYHSLCLWLTFAGSLLWAQALRDSRIIGGSYLSLSRPRFRDLVFPASSSNTDSRIFSWYLPSQPPQRSSSNGTTPRCNRRVARERK